MRDFEFNKVNKIHLYTNLWVEVGDDCGELRSMRHPTCEVLEDFWISCIFPTQGGVGTVCLVFNPINDEKPAFP